MYGFDKNDDRTDHVLVTEVFVVGWSKDITFLDRTSVIPNDGVLF